VRPVYSVMPDLIRHPAARCPSRERAPDQCIFSARRRGLAGSRLKAGM